MSSKDRNKVSAVNSKRNVYEDPAVNIKKHTKNSEDKEKTKLEANKLTSKEEKLSKKHNVKGEERKPNVINENTFQQKNSKNDFNDDVEERRLRRKEKEKSDKDGFESREDKNYRTKHQTDQEDYNKSKNKKEKVENSILFKENYNESKSRRLGTKEEESKIKNQINIDEFNIKSRHIIDESNTRHRSQSDKDTKNKHRTEKEESNVEDSKNRHRSKKEDESRSKHRGDKEEFGNMHKSSKEDSKSRHRDDKEESSNMRKSGKEESKSRHGDDKEESKSRHRTDKNIDNSQRKTSSNKDRIVTDEKGDKIISRNGKSSMDRKENLSENSPEIVEYEEDFDDYNDEDFEEVESTSTAISDDKEVIEDSPHSTSSKEIPMPTAYRNKNVELNDVPKNKDGIHSSFINFKLAQKKCSNDVVANKMLSRAYDLSRLIDLDRSYFDILDVAPVLEHSKYMVMFGRSGCQHIASQTGDDSMGRESQTEVIEERTLWCQHPPLDDEGCARVVLDTSRNNLGSLLANDTNKTALEMLNESGVSSAPLIQVLELMDRVLEEEASPEVSTKIASTANGQPVMSLGYNKYSCDSLPCIMAGFAAGNSAVFATVHQRLSADGDGRGDLSTTFVVTWRVSSNYREPQRYLSYPSHSQCHSCITSLTFSPDSCPSHLFGGLDTGLIALWDLREYSSASDTITGDPPAYFTGVPSEVSGHTHQTPIVALHTSSTKTTSSSYQLLSLDSSGNLSIWIVSSLQQTGSWTVASGSLADLNLRPGYRSRMSIIATVCLFPGPSPSAVTCMTIDATNPSQIFIGNHNGHILHHDRTVHNKPLQGRTHSLGRVYGSNESFESGSITHLDFYPFFESYFLAGYTDGSLKIFTTGRSEPLISFSSKQRAAILVCKWSKSHPAVFFSLDGEGHFAIWNVLTSVYRPVHSKKLPGYVGFDVSSDSRWHSSSQDRSVHNKARLLLWSLDGSIEVHELHPAFVAPQLDDCFKTCALLQSLL